MSFDALFEPIEIGDVTLKNRIAMSPMNMGYTGSDGYASDQTNAWYATRARGGFGLIITECVVANPFKWRGCDKLNPLMMSSQRHYRFLSQMVEVIHSYDKAKVFIQISPGWGRQGGHWLEDENIPSAAPSPVPLDIDVRNILRNKGWYRQMKRLSPDFIEAMGEKLLQMSDEEYAAIKPELIKGLHHKSPALGHYIAGEMPREMTIKEIHETEDFMVERIVDAYKLGFDGIEMHTPHGYLLHQFLSPRTNKRMDEYGGSIENRARIVTNILTRVRELIGPDKALGCRLSGDELLPDGINHEEECQVVKLVTDAGANFINVSQGSYERMDAAFAPDGEGDFTKWAPGFKKASGGLPIITPNFLTAEAAAEAIKSGSTDIISLGRQSIADPYWPVKVKAGREKEIVKCIRCQQCYMNLAESRWIRCTVNPTAGFEKYYPQLWMNDGMDKKAKRFLEKSTGHEQI